MSQAMHLISKNLPGYGLPDGGCLPCSGVSGIAVSASPCSSRADHRHSQTPKLLTLKCASRSTSYVCNASSSGHRRNPDFSRQNRQGFSRSRNRQYEEKDGFENFEDSEMFTSKNGPLLTGSGTPKFQATATPGPREKEIVELFRKVQAQLRERAAMKEEKKSEKAQGKGKESETVDSLLKLLRKHSVHQSKKSSNSISSRDFILEQPEPNFFSEDKSTNTLGTNSSARKERQDVEASVTNRPRSVFQRRSPIRHVKPQPGYSDVETVNSVSQTNIEDDKPESIRIPELEMESETESDTEQIFSDEGVFDEMSEDETSEIYHTDKDKEAEEHDMVQSSDLSEMKLPELRALAKSRGVKGFSKLKKRELIELLSGG